MSTPRLRILLLCDDNPANANTMLDHIHAFRKYSRHQIKTFNPRGLVRSRGLDFNEFDVVAVHWSLSLIYDHYLHRQFRDQIARFDGLKVHFLQDDYRWVERMTAEQRRLGIGVLFTLVSPEHFDKIWTPRLPGVRFVSTLPGYVPQDLLIRPAKPIAERELDIVYRGREVPWWLGRLGQDKVQVGRGVKALAEKVGLKVDIAWTESDRIYGERWNQFLGNSRTTIGCEGGASITDFDGSIEDEVLRYLADNPGASFDEVHAAVLAPHEGNVPMNVMTPRLFEAAALRTALVLFPGRYSDVLQPWQHYIPLEKDFSNFDAVARLIRDDAFLTELTERTYNEVALSPGCSLRGMVANFDQVVDEEGRKRVLRPPIGYEIAVAERRLSSSFNQKRLAVAKAAAGNRLVAPVAQTLSRFRIARFPAHYAAAGMAAIGATLRSRDQTALLARSVVPGLARHQVRPDRLLEDFLKFEILCRARKGVISGTLYRCRPYVRPGGVLEFRSFPDRVVDSAPTDDLEALAALEAGEITSVVWDHSWIGNSVYLPMSRKRWLTVWLGRDGRHEFSSFAEMLATDRPRGVRVIRRALAPHEAPLSNAGRRRPVAPPVSSSWKTPALARWRLPLPSGLTNQVRRLVRQPGGYLVRAYVMTRVIAPNPHYRRLVGRYLRDSHLRSLVPVDAVLGDILRVDALTRTMRTADGYHVCLLKDHDLRQWSYVTGGHANASVDDTAEAQPPSSIRWDHSAVSNRIDIPTLRGRHIEVALGTGGVYEFAAMAALARVEPGAVAGIFPPP